MRIIINGQFLKMEKKEKINKDTNEKTFFYVIRFLIDNDTFDFFVFNNESYISKLDKLKAGDIKKVTLELLKYNNNLNLKLIDFE